MHILEPLNNPIILQLTSSKNEFLSNVPIISFFQTNGDSQDITFDIDDYSSVTNSNWNQDRIAWSNEFGVATFQNISLLNIGNLPSRNISCINGYFYFGLATDLSIRSLYSELIKYCQNISVFLMDSPDKEIYYLNPLQERFNFMVDFPPNISINLFNSLLSFSVRIVKMKSRELLGLESIYITDTMLSNSTCIKMPGTKLVDLYKACYINVAKVEDAYHLLVYFTTLKLQTMTLFTNIDLQLCFFNFCSYSFLGLSQIQITKPFSGCFTPKIDIPSKIYIDEIYPISFQISSFEQCPIPSSLIHCNINSLDQEKYATKRFNSMMNLLSNSVNMIDAYNIISKYRGISELNEDYLYTLSDNNDISITFEFVSVNPGYHIIQCSSLLPNAIVSNIFYLFNYISEIKIQSHETFLQKLSFNTKITGEILPTNITLDFEYAIAIFDNNSKLLPDHESYLFIEACNEDFMTYFASLDKPPQPDSSDVYTKLTNLYNMLFTGISTMFKNEELQPIEAYGNITYDNGYYRISSITFELEQPSIIRLRFSCRGIYSNFSNPITIEQVNYNGFISFCVYFQTYIFLLSILCIILLNSTYFDILGMALTLIITGFNICVFIFANYGNVSIFSGLIILGALFLTISYQFYLLCKFGKEFNFNLARINTFKQYTSSKLKFLLQNTKPFKKVDTVQSNKGNEEIDLLSQRKFNKEYKNNKIKIEIEIEKPTDLPKKGRKKTLYLKMEKKVLGIFFSNDAFYFSQRFIMSILICIFILTLCVFAEINLAYQIISILSSLKTSVLMNIYSALSSMIDSFRKNINHDLTAADLEIFTEALNLIGDMIQSIISSFFAATIASNILICVIFCVTIMLSVKKYKKISIQARTDKKLVESLKEFEIEKVFSFPGLILGLAALSYIVECFLLTVIFTCLFNKLFWIILWEFRVIIFIILFPSACMRFFEKVAFYFIFKSNGTIIVNRNLLQIVEAIELTVSIVNGVGYIVVRFIFSTINLFISYSRFHDNPLNEGFNVPILEDELFQSYMAILRLQSIYSNPIFCHCANELSKSTKKNTRATKKFWKVLVCIKNPLIKKK